MPTPIAPRIIVAQNAHVELQTVVRAHTTPQSLALRARIILRAAAVDQPTNLQIGRELGCSNLTAGKWRRRYLALGFPGPHSLCATLFGNLLHPFRGAPTAGNTGALNGLCACQTRALRHMQI
jgi:hypothetical protein